MCNLTRTCLIVSACCIISLHALAIRNEKPTSTSASNEEADDFDFDFGHFIDVGDDDDEEEEEVATKGKSANLEKARTLEPEAEMLPAHYEGVKPPGVDHMEMTRVKRLKKEEEEEEK